MKPKRKAENDVDTCVGIVISLLNDFVYRFLDHYCLKDFQLDCATVINRAQHEGLSFFTLTLPALSTTMLRNIETGSLDFTPGFQSCKHGYPCFLKGLFRLVYTREAIDDSTRTDAVRCIYQVAVMFSKLRGPFDVDKLKNQLNDFLFVDQNLPSVDEISEKQILHRARYITTKIFSDVDEKVWDRIIPKPGPGATNQKRSPKDRYRPNIFFDSIDDVFPYQEWFYSTYYEARSDQARLIRLLKAKHIRPTSRFKFVPKKVGKARGICIEENEQQYIQQGVKSFLYKFIENHSLLKDSVHFTHQSYNALAALSSSKDGELATLDMKEASDRVSRELVDFIFSHTNNIRSILDCCSTRTITFENCYDNCDVAPLNAKKFAPMGSGVCFPIMGYLHWVLIVSILYEKCKLLPQDYKLLIYGDDIILPSQYVETIYEYLPKFGMKFNQDKSFYRGKFRESCGLHAFNGESITPIYIKYLPKSQRVSPAELQSIIANERGFYTAGYRRLTNYYHERIKLREVRAGSSEVGWWRDTPKDLIPSQHKKRWNEEYLCWQFKLKCFKSKFKGTNPLLPLNGRTFVLDRRQVEMLQDERNNWSENDAYLRRLLTSAESHERFWGFERVTFQNRWL